MSQSPPWRKKLGRAIPFRIIQGGGMSSSDRATVQSAERAHIRSLRKILKWVQWSSVNGSIGRHCPKCGEERPDHHEHCELAALIAVDFDLLPPGRE